MAKTELLLPSFLIIGAERCATRWLRFHLDQHPDIFVPRHELNFWNDAEGCHERGSMKRYSAMFEGREDEQFVGESSPSYLAWNSKPVGVARRIYRMMPDVRLIAIVREPVDRMYSALVHQIKLGNLPPDSDLFQMVSSGDPALKQFDIMGNSNYGSTLFPYHQRFGDRLKVLFLDDIRTDPAAVYRQALEHIGAPTDFEPRQLDRVMFSDRQSTAVTIPPPSLLHRQLIYFYVRKDVEQLAAMTGRDLSSWDPGEWDSVEFSSQMPYDAV